MSNKYTQDAILAQIQRSMCEENALAVEVSEKGWSRKKVIFTQVSSEDFPRMSEKDMKIIVFTGK